MHDTYRRNFNGVDLFNRDCFGSYSLQQTVLTRSWHRRMFLAILGMCETNAMKAYRTCVGPISRFEWLAVLSEKLINNPFLEAGEATAAAGTGQGGTSASPAAGLFTPFAGASSWGG